MADDGDGSPLEPTSGDDLHGNGLANGERLMALGDAVDRKSVNGAKHARRRTTRRRKWLYAGVAVLVLIVGVAGGGYWYANYRFTKIPRFKQPLPITYPVPGQPFNVLAIGSDSRAGLSSVVARQTGANTGSVSGQRSDVIKVIHVDPNAGTITILSIPRDTTVSLLANQNLYGQFNRINVNYGAGPALLVRTITANFGIPINHVIQVNFNGLIGAADAVGGVYLDFRYPSHDPWSDLAIWHPGCQLVTSTMALAVARSRHFYYAPKGHPPWPKDWLQLSDDQLAADGWVYDGTSDFGRIDRQTSFLRAMFARVKSKLDDPLALNAFLGSLPQGITIDNTFTLRELIGLALKFHGYNTATMKTYTMPEVPATVNGADLEFVEQPYAQQLLVSIFGSSLRRPTNPPPNTALQTPQPPNVAVATTTTTLRVTTTSKKPKHPVSTTTAPTTTTTNPTLALPIFDPVPCTPK
jgi:LCP family protein required for cell wall assembly